MKVWWDVKWNSFLRTADGTIHLPVFEVTKSNLMRKTTSACTNWLKKNFMTDEWADVCLVKLSFSTECASCAIVCCPCSWHARPCLYMQAGAQHAIFLIMSAERLWGMEMFSLTYWTEGGLGYSGPGSHVKAIIALSTVAVDINLLPLGFGRDVTGKNAMTKHCSHSASYKTFHLHTPGRLG